MRLGVFGCTRLIRSGRTLQRSATRSAGRVQTAAYSEPPMAVRPGRRSSSVMIVPVRSISLWIRTTRTFCMQPSGKCIGDRGNSGAEDLARAFHFKTTDGGETWSELTRTPGFPSGVLGKMTVTVSGADSERVWANIEAEDGGLYLSDDGGMSWALVNTHRDIWQRAFYFQRIQADPVDRNTIYILNFRLMKSTDSGRTT